MKYLVIEESTWAKKGSIVTLVRRDATGSVVSNEFGEEVWLYQRRITPIPEELQNESDEVIKLYLSL